MTKTEKHILIVDDNLKNLQITAKLLRDEGYLINLAQSGEMALKQLEDYTPDLILLDVMMPEIDGFEVCRRIKGIKKLKDIPIVFLTAKNETEDLLDGFKAGGVDYITKPYKKEELLIRAKNHIELADSRKKIIRMNKTRDKLYSIIAHDIKSPLTNISMLIQAITDGLIDPASEDFKEIISDLGESTSDTLILLQNLLKWTELQRDSITLYPLLTSANPVIEDCVKLLSGNADSKNITIEIETSKSAMAFFDEVSIHTVIRNLVTNAIKFTPRGGRIRIYTIRESEYLKIHIVDNGIGIKKDILEKILAKEEPYTSPGTDKEQGTGLGLMLVKDFVTKNRGMLKINSTEGLGTEVIVSLPFEEKNN